MGDHGDRDQTDRPAAPTPTEGVLVSNGDDRACAVEVHATRQGVVSARKVSLGPGGTATVPLPDGDDSAAVEVNVSTGGVAAAATYRPDESAPPLFTVRGGRVLVAGGR